MKKINTLKRVLLASLMLLTLQGFIQSQLWQQIGQDIDGEAADDRSGIVSINSDGSIIAIGAGFNDGNGNLAGHVRIFENILGTWTQIGDDIDGEGAIYLSGGAVSLSSDGSIVAIGSTYTGGDLAGQVEVYQNQSGSWVQLGNDIEGDPPTALGSSVSLSSDGTIVAIGAPGGSESVYTGLAKIYEYQAGSWVQIGSDIVGEAIGDKCGTSVSISDDGTIVAIGAHMNDGNYSNSGHVRIFENQSGSWVQLGSDIDGDYESKSGSSVSLNADGNILSIGGYGSNSLTWIGYVRVYEYQAGSWTQIGNDIMGEAIGDNFGNTAQCLNSDGSIIAIGGPLNDDGGEDAGHVRIFKNMSGSWIQIGDDIYGEAANDGSGFVSLNSDGTAVAIGAGNNDGNGSQSGHVRVYELQLPPPPSPDPPTTGDGSSGDPYQIETLNNLYWLSQNSAEWDKYYIQVADINAQATLFWAGDSGFPPIGNSTTNFDGSYNGDGFTIDRLFISLSIDDVGLFGRGWALSIENLGLTNVNISGNNRVGGILGFTYYGSVVGCYSTGNVFGNDEVGGLVGRITGSILESYSTATVSGNKYLGGLLGYGFGYFITNCYSRGDVSGADYIGGLIGVNNSIETSHCFSTGNVSGTGSNLGGLVASNNDVISDCFWDTQTSGQSTSAGGTGKTTTEMKDIDTFTDLATTGLTTPWDFYGDPNDDTGTDDHWDIDANINNGYTFLLWNHIPLTWKGSANSDWNTGTNWSQVLGLPRPGKSVIIPSSPTGGNFPETNYGAGAECDDLTIESGAHLYIPSNNTLTVNGTLTNNAGTSGLIIKSTANDATGSLIHATPGVNATVEKYLTDMQWHFIGMPVESETIEVFHLPGGHSNIYLRTHIESTNTWDDWIVPVSTPLIQGRGYEVWVGDDSFHQDEIIEFAGAMNSGDYNTGTGDFYDLQYTTGHGLNLICNPYPSAIEADIDTWTKTNIDNSVWTWDGTAGNYVYWNGTNGTNESGWGTLTGGIIPAMQAFFVLANGSGPSLTIPQSSRTHSSQPYYKEGGLPNTIRLDVEGNGYKDAIFVSFHEQATDEYDGEYDVIKIFGLAEAPQLYSIIPGEVLSINSIPELNEYKLVELGFECNISDFFTIVASEFESFDENITIYLEDKKEGIMHNLCENPTYSFLHETGDDPNRFLLHFGDPSGIDEPVQQNTGIYSYDNIVYIHQTEDLNATVFIYNTLGHKIYHETINNQKLTRIQIPNGTGYYIVQVQNGNRMVTKKVFLK